MYTSPYTPTGNYIIGRTHTFLKASLRKIIHNHNTDLDNIAHIATMAYVFLHSLSEEAPFYLMLGWDAYMSTLFKLLLPKIRYMGDEKCRIHLDAMKEVYMMAVCNLKTAIDKCPPSINNPNKTDFKIGDMVPLKNHTPMTAFYCKYKLRFRICIWLFDKAFNVKDNTRKLEQYPSNIYNYYIQLTKYWHTYLTWLHLHGLAIPNSCPTYMKQGQKDKHI